ncbi:MerR family transcriptional regulator [Catellatospora sichuanensis]|uniref:MerR family transcriptional regulator n=1 Tax=Catellatospora sichuanensis TaxID=1969805 RepID=UPI0011823CAA|nr:MerR family transcriptional regulator [Catellatospora sichuanensis]
MRIGELAQATGRSPRSLRYYEEQGLLGSGRSTGGQRHYPPTAVERVALIRSLLAAGLSSSTIYDVLPCITEQAIRTPALAARLRDELTRVDEQIRGMQQTREVLADLVDHYSATEQVS